MFRIHSNVTLNQWWMIEFSSFLANFSSLYRYMAAVAHIAVAYSALMLHAYRCDSLSLLSRCIVVNFSVDRWCEQWPKYRCTKWNERVCESSRVRKLKFQKQREIKNLGEMTPICAHVVDVIFLLSFHFIIFRLLLMIVDKHSSTYATWSELSTWIVNNVHDYNVQLCMHLLMQMC